MPLEQGIYDRKQDGGNFKPVSILKKAGRLTEARNKEVVGTAAC